MALLTAPFILLLASVFLTLRANAQQPPLPGQTVQFRTGLSDDTFPSMIIPPATQFDNIQSTGPTGGCLTASNNADGAPVVIEMCSAPTPGNSWVVPNGNNAAGALKIFGNKCLDVTDGINTDGTRLQIWICASGNTNQLWEPEFGSVGSIQWAGKNKCVDLTDGNTTRCRFGPAIRRTRTRFGE
ncbi:hypothetical protein R3P38DRAFT_547780 [Favolaschia claudopus]|uniref:Ricin B lectin domain-containing protein n=1 Tax=Favolaschia claudopus TaxID=2862362 RepID=A0AAW0CI89_9AGAR